MKKILKFFATVFIVTILFSCTKDEEFTKSSQEVYWRETEGPPIDGYVNDELAGTITTINSVKPTCGDTGNVTVTLNVGVTYQIYAVQRETGAFWNFTSSGTEIIDCLPVALE